MKNRVAITGIGAITPLGIGIEENWQNIKQGRQALATAEFPGSDCFSHTVCGSVNHFDAADFIPQRKMLKLMNREARLAVAAAGMALHDAGITDCYSSYRTGLYLGTGLTSGQLPDLIRLVENSIAADNFFSYQKMGTAALPNCNPLLSFKILTNMPLCYISILFQVKGPNLVFNPWSGNTAQAIGEGMMAIKHGEVDCAVVGGCDSKNHYTGFLTFTKLGLLSKKGISRPFAKERDGVVLSEGACILILENLEKAESRKAKIYAELSGYAAVTDADSKTLFSRNPEILEKAMQQAVSHSELVKDDIDFVCAAANSHPVGDLAEARAMDAFFQGNTPPVIALKALTGDMIAAAAPFELAVCALALKEKTLPPQVFAGEQEENILRQSARITPGSTDIKAALANSFELGSAKVSLLTRRYS